MTTCKNCGMSKFKTIQRGKLRFDICIICGKPKTKRGEEIRKVMGI